MMREVSSTRFFREPGVDEHLRPPGRLHVGLGVDALLLLRDRGAECLQKAPQEVGVETRPRGDLGRRITLRARVENALDGQQHQPVLLNGALQVVERDARFRQLLEQGKPRLARLPAQASKQPFGLEVHARHRP